MGRWTRRQRVYVTPARPKAVPTSSHLECVTNSAASSFLRRLVAKQDQLCKSITGCVLKLGLGRNLHVQTSHWLFQPVTRRLRRRPQPEPRESAGRRRRGAARLVYPDPHISA